MNLRPLKLTLVAGAFCTTQVHALPIDWHGTFGVDTTMISGYRLIKNETDTASVGNAGSQEVSSADGSKQSASWQSYVFRLNPEILINDSATFKGEFSTGYGSGGTLGDAPETRKESTTANNRIGDALYYYNQTSGKELTLTKAYLEIYSDTATYQVGRHTYNWGLGALYNDGGNAWDRFSYSRDGVTMKVKLGNFHANPFWSKIANIDSLARGTYAKEYGIGLLYDNPEKDIAFGLNYTVKSSSSLNTTYKTDTSGATRTIGKADVKVTDIYFKKIFGKFDFAVEVPLLNGDIGGANAAGNPTKLSSKAVVFESNYRHSEAVTFGFDAGNIDGNDSNAGQFDAAYLNPNFHVANILFRYNMAAVKDESQSIYDSYMTNALYLKARAQYRTEKWIFDGAIIHAKANETATAGANSYNHTKHKYFTATATQDDTMGTEVDLGATYKWNNEISIGTKLGYLFTGDYYGFNDTATPNETKNALLLQANVGVTF